MMAVISPIIIALSFVVLGLVWRHWFGFYPLQGNSWTWVAEYTRAYGSVPSFVLYGIYATAGIAIALIVAIQALASQIGVRTTHGGRDAASVHGSARWAVWSDVKKAGLWRKTGVVVGGWAKLLGGIKTLRHDGPEHLLLFAPTGSGKGIGIVLPTLLSWAASAIVLDIKAENWRLTSGWRASLGQRILKFDPTAETGSVRFNPLAEVRLRTGYEVADAQNIASMIIDPDGKGLADFWAKSGFSWLTSAILYTLYRIERDEGRVAGLPDVDAVLTAPGDGLDSLLEDMLGFDTMSPAANAVIRSGAQDMKDRAAQERSGVQSSAKVDLSLYRDPVVAKNISTSDFRLADLMNGDRPATLYLVVPPSDIDRLRPLLRVVMNLFLRRLLQNEGGDGKPAFKHRLLLMLDEFTALGKLDIFERALAYMRGYGIKAYIVIQDIKQLTGAYGRDNAIMGNCQIRVAYAPNDVDTAKVLSDMAGKTTIVQEKRSTSRKALALMGTVSDSVAEISRPLMTPDEIMRLAPARKSKLDDKKVVAPGEMLIFSAGSPPILGRQTLYFLDKDLKRRSELAPVGEAVSAALVEAGSSSFADASSADATGVAEKIRAALNS